jgi:SAM-dependent methyltransferase
LDQQTSHLDPQRARETRPTELRYRVADFINDRLKIVPGIHAGMKAAVASLTRGRAASNGNVGQVSDRGEGDQAPPLPSDSPGHQPVAESQVSENGGTQAPPIPREIVSLDALPFPPLEMRKLVGPTELEAFDNPDGRLVYDYLDVALYDKVFDFGCGCGRVARQLLLQRPSPRMYVGIDLHPGMIRWCQRNLQPAAPDFSFFHHDVFNTRFNPQPGKPTTAPFPVADSQFTLVNAISVFTHLIQEQAVHYLHECARILAPEGVLHASWFLFDKQDYPMLQEDTNALYVSYDHPNDAVIFDRNWMKNTAHQFGLKICRIVPPHIRGHQWVVMMTKRVDVEEPEFPPDTAPTGLARPMAPHGDPSRIGMEPE